MIVAAQSQPGTFIGASLTPSLLPHAAQLLLQVGDLVAEPGGQLELQLGRRPMHLVGQLLDELGQVGAGSPSGEGARRPRPPAAARPAP